MSAAKRNMVVGGLICLAGIVVTAATYSAAKGGGTYVVAYGAIAVGALQVIRGLFQHFTEPDGDSATPSKTMLALHAMAYVAATDGAISDKECQAMNGVLRRLTGAGLPDDELKRLLTQIGRVSFASQSAVEHLIASMTRDERETILKCAIIAGLSDDGISDAEWERVCEVAVTLEFSPDDLQALMQRLLPSDEAAPAEPHQQAAT